MGLALFDEFRPQHEAAHAFDIAFDFFRVSRQANVLHLRSTLHRERRTFNLQILRHDDSVAIVQFIAIAVAGNIGHRDFPSGCKRKEPPQCGGP